MTEKNVRHCVNSLSLEFVPAGTGEAAAVGGEAPAAGEVVASAGRDASSTAYFAGGCFWGVEHAFQSVDGVSSVRSGYMGGDTDDPTYREVCGGRTGHAEAVEVVFDPEVVSYETLTRLFFEIHDPTQVDRQGPDRGTQYRSAVFYADEDQKQVAERLIAVLRDKGFDVATEVTEAGPFWEAEEYHQDYYEKTGGSPYCHTRQKKF
jgi:peptide methionine sulfoxide reductase msrA/msrB